MQARYQAETKKIIKNILLSFLVSWYLHTTPAFTGNVHMLGNKNNLDWGFYVETDDKCFFLLKVEHTKVTLKAKRKFSLHSSFKRFYRFYYMQKCISINRLTF